MGTRYEYSNRATTRSLLSGLDRARREGRIYVIANLVKMIRFSRMRLDVDLRKTERVELLCALGNARKGPLPLATWLPRGYQVARLLMLSMLHMPERVIVPTKRDRRQIKSAIQHYRSEPHDWHSRRQLGSLLRTCTAIGIQFST
jgi:hypothetical protein